MTAIGHSKGGNKAMYVGILSERVDRVLSLDGQGFNSDFFKKYQAEICARGGNITNISVNTDYVNALLAQFPNSRQLYVRGDEDDSLNDIASHHVPASIFSRDANGNYLLTDGNITFTFSPKDPRLMFETGLTIYLMNSATVGDLKLISQFGQSIVNSAFGGGEELSFAKVMEDKEGLATTLAYTFRYLQSTGQSTRNIGEFAEAISLIGDYDDLIYTVNLFGKEIKVDVIQFFYNWLVNSTVNDRGDDQFTRHALLLASLIAGEDLLGLYDMVHEKYWEIADSGRESTVYPTISCCETRDFSDDTKCTIEETHHSLAQVTLDSISSWSSYSSEEWYGQIFAPSGVSGNKSYDSNMVSLLERTLKEITRIFTEAKQLDKDYGSKMDNKVDELTTLTRAILELAESIG